MSVSNFKEARHHVGHKIVCVIYGKQNVSIECETCCEVLASWERGENNNEKSRSGNRRNRNRRD